MQAKFFKTFIFAKKLVCESNAESSTNTEISNFDCKNTQNTGLKTCFAYEKSKIWRPPPSQKWSSLEKNVDPSEKNVDPPGKTSN